MSYPINYPRPQGANVQIFGASTNPTANGNSETWTKPQGASFVWFTLIGAGGTGDTSVGGGSGAVTNFMCPAFLIPDSLQVSIYAGGVSGGWTSVFYQQKDGTGYNLLQAANGSASAAGPAMSANFFTAMGFFQSIQGQGGTSAGNSPSSTTFLAGGAASTASTNYGYSASSGDVNGFFQMQPIIVGCGGSQYGKGGTGCGGGIYGGKGGDGLVVIITW